MYMCSAHVTQFFTEYYVGDCKLNTPHATCLCNFGKMFFFVELVPCEGPFIHFKSNLQKFALGGFFTPWRQSCFWKK
jgi:hypothetical protein